MNFDVTTIRVGDELVYEGGRREIVASLPQYKDKTWLVYQWCDGERVTDEWSEDIIEEDLLEIYRDGECIWYAKPEKPAPEPRLVYPLKRKAVAGNATCDTPVGLRQALHGSWFDHPDGGRYMFAGYLPPGASEASAPSWCMIGYLGIAADRGVWLLVQEISQ